MALPTDIADLHTIIFRQEKTIARQRRQIDRLLAQVASLGDEVAALRKQINQNSSNSHRPPSSDGFTKKPALPRKNSNQGGQKGHKGDTLKMVSEPDSEVKCAPERCSCGKRLLRQAMDVHSRRQVFDIPTPKLIVTEYQQLQCQCPDCGKVNVGSFPAPVKAPVQYGSGVRTLVSMLHVKCQLSYQNIGHLFDDLYGQPINAATMQQAVRKSHEALKPVEAQVIARLLLCAILHADETGLRIEGKRNWVHALCSEYWTFLYAHSSRGKKAIESEIAELFEYAGVLVHDCFGSYWGLTKAKHALCGVHLLRELTSLIEDGSSWAKQMHALLMKLYNDKEKGKVITRNNKAWRSYDKICAVADKAEPPPERRPRGKAKRTKGRNLAERMAKYKVEVLRYAMEEHVPFTNNQAERDLRPVKGKQKVAGCFRTFNGAHRYARLQGVFSTWRKQGYSVFEELKSILEGNEFVFSPLRT